jgi:hypothetical protein
LLSNLVDQEINIQFNQQSDGYNTGIRLIDLSGRPLLHKQIRPLRGDIYKINLSALNLSKGMYLIEISNGAEKWIEKVMKK